MEKYEQLWKIAEEGEGYLRTADVVAAGISRTYLAKFVKDNDFERAAQGVYVKPDVFPDELYILQTNNPQIIFSGETALYLQGLTDREYSGIFVTMPSGSNGSRMRSRGIYVHQTKEEIYRLGIEKIATNFGHDVRTYDKERCICDLVKAREKTEIQIFQTAIKEYMHRRDKKLSKLIEYAKVLNIRDEVMKYIEVMV